MVRLEGYNYNVPPITDTTRNVLMKKLKQYEDTKPKAFTPGLDYSSGEDDFTPPVSSTRKQRGVPASRSRPNVRNGSVSKDYMDGPYKSSLSSNMVGRNGHSLMQQSEEEEEEDSDEVEEDSDEKFEEYEEDIRLGRNDLAVQTSFESPDSESRFRGKAFVPSPSSLPNSTIKSQHLRKNLDKFGSLGEALITLPTNKPSSSPTMVSRSHTPQQSSPVTQAQRSAARQTYKENLGHNVVVSSLIIIVAALFFTFLCYQYVNLKSSPQQRQKIPICTAAEHSTEALNSRCIPGTKLEGTAQLLQKLLKVVIHDHSCQKHKYSLAELRQEMTIDEKSEEYFEYALMLLKNNPSWGVELIMWDDEITHVVTAETSSGVYCWLEYSVQLVYGIILRATNYIMLIGIVLVALYSIRRFWKNLRERKEIERRDMFMYVERVLAMLHEHHQTKDGHAPSYLAIDHIRDQLIPPQERESKAAVWKEALKYIRNHESRVREEVQHIHGEEFRVWQWLPDIPLGSPAHTSSLKPHSLSSSMLHQRQAPTSSMNRTRNVEGKPMMIMKKDTTRSQDPWPGTPSSSLSPGSPGWQGSAIQQNRNILSSVKPPTSCLKARYMFDASQLDSTFIKRLKKDIVSRCSDASILHIAVDTDSQDGIVYIKTMSTEDAGLVFKNIHGQWYNKQLVVVKYLREDRYHQRFPDTVNLEVPLSNH